jgi:3-deoxy-D-manno-octulosonate cytidylyltransferase
MRTAIVIPARLASIRLPGKPLAVLGGLPLVVRVWQQACKAKNVDEVVVATDDAAIAQIVRVHGGTAMMTRADHASGTDRCAEAARELGAELVINLQGDEPFVVPADLAALFNSLEHDDVEVTTLKAPIASPEEFLSRSVVKVVCRSDDLALYFSRAPVPFDQTGTHSLDNCFRHVGVYGYRREALERLCQMPLHPLEARESLEQLRALALGMRIKVLVAQTRGVGIDTPEDLKQAQARIDAVGEAAFPS